MDISDSQIERSLARTERRHAEAIATRRRQKRNATLGLVLLVVLVVLGGMFLGARSGSQAPVVSTVVLTWPMKDAATPQQFIADGATLLIKKGQALNLSVPQANVWDAVWKAGTVQTKGDSYVWKPQGHSSHLTVEIRPRWTGWRKLFSWSRPMREIHLRGLAGTPLESGDNSRHEVETPTGGLWLANRTLAKVPVRYDERALQVLSSVAQNLGQSQGDSATADEPVWQLIPSFTGDKALPGDIGTSALLKTAQPAEDARRAFQILNRTVPKATIKVIVEKGKPGDPGEARFRLSFDDKGGRFVWVQNQGNEESEPEDWLADEIAEEATPTAQESETNTTTE
ncbi:MAG TPA: hypothetical protein VGB77_05650 [Abditibacteriaceae bacterium]|jgi:hypothetical protein